MDNLFNVLVDVSDLLNDIEELPTVYKSWGNVEGREQMTANALRALGASFYHYPRNYGPGDRSFLTSITVPPKYHFSMTEEVIKKFHESHEVIKWKITGPDVPLFTKIRTLIEGSTRTETEFIWKDGHTRCPVIKDAKELATMLQRRTAVTLSASRFIHYTKEDEKYIDALRIAKEKKNMREWTDEEMDTYNMFWFGETFRRPTPKPEPKKPEPYSFVIE